VGRTAACLALAALLGAAPARAEDPARVEELLASVRPDERERGIAALGAKPSIETAKRLLSFLADPDWGVRLAAIRAIGPVDFKPARDLLMKQAVEGEIRAIRRLAAEMLREHDAAEYARRLGKLALQFQKEERVAPIQALGTIGGEESVRALERLATATDPLHRAEAVRALGGLRAGEKALLRALGDREPLVRLRAADALARIDSDAARDALLAFAEGASDGYVLRRIGRYGAAANEAAFVAALTARLERTKRPAALLEVAAASGAKGCAPAAKAHLRAVDPIARAFAARVVRQGGRAEDAADVVPLLDDKDERVRRAAARCVAALADPARGDAYEALLAHPQPEAAMAGVRAAWTARHKGSVRRLLDLVEGGGAAKSSWQVRVAAAVAAGWVGGLEAFDALRRLAESSDWKLRAAALEGLFRIYDKASIPVLIQYFDDRHPVSRLAARKNLQFMTQKKYATRDQFVAFWEREKDRFDLVHPEEGIRRLRESGYSVRRDMIEVLRKTDFVCILGRWDKVEKVLDDLQIPKAAIRAQEVKDYGLNPKQVILVNCEGSVDTETAEIVQWCVVAGGYMATTDWALVNALRRTFPGIVEKYGKRSTSNDVVVIEEGAPGHPVLREVFRPDVELKWWLEIIAFPLELVDPVHPDVLVDSLEMLLRYERSAMMVEFEAGLGKVLHSTSHFYLQTEGFAKETSPARRRIFAADHLGIPVEEIRKLDRVKFWENLHDTTPISKNYSMFHLLVNFIEEKQRVDLGR
jgi:HEAT repeat protein